MCLSPTSAKTMPAQPPEFNPPRAELGAALRAQKRYCDAEEHLLARLSAVTDPRTAQARIIGILESDEMRGNYEIFQDFKQALRALVAATTPPGDPWVPQEPGGDRGEQPGNVWMENVDVPELRPESDPQTSERSLFKIHVQVECRSRVGAWMAVLYAARTQPTWSGLGRGALGFRKYKMVVGAPDSTEPWFSIQGHLWEAQAPPVVAMYCHDRHAARCATVAVNFAHKLHDTVARGDFRATYGVLRPMMYLPPRFNARLTDLVFMANGNGETKQKTGSNRSMKPPPPPPRGRPKLTDYLVAPHLKALQAAPGKPPACADGWAFYNDNWEPFLRARREALAPFEHDPAFMAQTRDAQYGDTAATAGGLTRRELWAARERERRGRAGGAPRAGWCRWRSH